MLHGTQLLTQHRCAKSRAKSWIVLHHLKALSVADCFTRVRVLPSVHEAALRIPRGIWHGHVT